MSKDKPFVEVTNKLIDSMEEEIDTINQITRDALVFENRIHISSLADIVEKLEKRVLPLYTNMLSNIDSYDEGVEEGIHVCIRYIKEKLEWMKEEE